MSSGGAARAQHTGDQDWLRQDQEDMEQVCLRHLQTSIHPGPRLEYLPGVAATASMLDERVSAVTYG
ncbi:hypothetical protein OC835_004671 [Tilletia horrida]|nr:hypothetical protein OC835_004671 [Tilletia horrida]